VFGGARKKGGGKAHQNGRKLYNPIGRKIFGVSQSWEEVKLKRKKKGNGEFL